MPIYEFFSPDTNRIYSFFARSLAEGGNTPKCPDDPKARMERMLSRFAVTGRNKEAPGTSSENASDSRVEGALAEMEREMAGLDADNPDPRHLGRMMRKMADLTGQKMPETMRTMIERLERGEDPEKLEEEYGESLDNMAEELPEEATEEKKILSRLRPKGPTRDPKLYEMRDYL